MGKFMNLEEIQKRIAEEVANGFELDQETEKGKKKIAGLFCIQNLMLSKSSKDAKKLADLEAEYFFLWNNIYKNDVDLEKKITKLMRLDHMQFKLDELQKQHENIRLARAFVKDSEKNNKKIQDLATRVDEVSVGNKILADEIAKKNIEYGKVKADADRIKSIAKEIGDTSSDRCVSLKTSFSEDLPGLVGELLECSASTSDCFNLIEGFDGDDLPQVKTEKMSCRRLLDMLETEIQVDLNQLQICQSIVSNNLNRAVDYYQRQLEIGILGDVDIIGQYCRTKDLIKTDPEGALEGFSKIFKMEPEKGIWGFRALRQIIKIYHNLGKYEEMMDAYKEMLTYIEWAVPREQSEHCINTVMDFVSVSASLNSDLLQEFYQTTLKDLDEAKYGGRLWFKASLELCKIWLNMREYGGRMSEILKELHEFCQKDDVTNDPKKGTRLFEVYAIEIQMYTNAIPELHGMSLVENNKKLKQVYEEALSNKSVKPHPRIMGIIHECGGKMFMAEHQWDLASLDFLEAFQIYQNWGYEGRIQCLKYLIVVNLLMGSENPCDADWAKRCKYNPEILAMANLIEAYRRHDLLEFEKVTEINREELMDDQFLRNYIEDLRKNINILN